MSLKENWHRKLRQPNNKVLEKVLKNYKVKTSSRDKFSFCEACQSVILHLLPFKSSSTHGMEPLELIQSDVCGPAPILSPLILNIMFFSLMITIGSLGFFLKNKNQKQYM